jgi:phosphatidylglycerophosphate synthase
MDPLADKIMTCSAFIAFVESTHLNPDAPVKVAAWMVVIIVARELAITGLRLLAASKNVVLAAERSASTRPFRKSWPSSRCSWWTPATNGRRG